VESKWQGNTELCRNLQRHRPTRECGDQRSAVEVPSEQRSNEVGAAKDVESTGEDGAGDAVGNRRIPGHLWLVNAEVGRDWAEFALVDEDFVGISGSNEMLGWCACGCWSGRYVSLCLV
jgi:hypothetical protein